MTTQNKSVSDGFKSVTDGLLEYRKAITKKLEVIAYSETELGRKTLFEGWLEDIDYLLEAVVPMSDAIGGMETFFIEFGVYQADGKAD